MKRALVVGMAVTGQAVTRGLLTRGWEVVATDDAPTPAVRAAASELKVTVHEAPDAAGLGRLAGGVDTVVVSPGVPARHPVFALDPSGPEVISEIELGSRWTGAPIVAVTGTNGKTTVVTLITRMLAASGVGALAAGNIGLPLVEAVDQVGPDDVLVVEVSSFQLALTRRFHPSVAVWLNLAEDHLDWHPDFEHYASAKARIWRNQGPEDWAVVNAEDPAVMRAATDVGHPAPSQLVTFGVEAGDYRGAGGVLTAPDGTVIGAVGDLRRALPHDIANALAASAAAMAVGATPAGCGAALREFEGLPHRVALIGESGGVRFYDDSKATTPASVLAALSGFESVVLIAGGRNKGLDLGVLRDGADHVRSVVALGEAADEVAAAFDGVRPVARAASMPEAVEKAASEARPGDVVLLSPGCASFDWYASYAERGRDFSAAVSRLIDRRAAG